MRVFIDTNVPMYAAGAVHPYREPCRSIVMAIASGSVDAVTDAEVFQELLYRYLHINRREQGLVIFDRFHTLMDAGILSVTMGDVGLARDLADTYPDLSPRDLVHVAVMIHHELRHIVSIDQKFDLVKEVVRIDPVNLVQDLS